MIARRTGRAINSHTVLHGIITTIMATNQSMIIFFFNDTATTESYTLSLHDALPISSKTDWANLSLLISSEKKKGDPLMRLKIVFDKADRKSTRLNSSHGYISYAVFCLKKTTEAAGRVVGTEEDLK